MTAFEKGALPARQGACPVAAAAIQGIRFISLYEPSGYGTAARRYLQGLKRSGIPLTWTPMVPGKGWNLGYEPFPGKKIGDPELDPCCNREIEYDHVIVHTVPEYYPLWSRREPGKTLVGCTVWETDKPPRHWIDLLNGMDLLLVPCRWNREVFHQSGVTVPIHVIPHIMRQDQPPEGLPYPGTAPGDLVFYTIGTWTVRKALWHTIDAYLDTFSGHDPTVLIVKTTPADLTRLYLNRFRPATRSRVRQMVRRRKTPARIELITDSLTEGEILKLHGRGDCYISLTRSEGWGLGAFDAASFGRPVIMTGFGGQRDYLPRHLAYLVDYDPIPVRDRLGGKSYSRDQTWAEPRLAHASRLLRQVFENREEARARGRALQAHIRQHFDETRVTARLLNVLAGALRNRSAPRSPSNG